MATGRARLRWSGRWSPSSGGRMSASPRWSTASSGGARPSSRTSRASPATAWRMTPSGRRQFTLVDTGGWEIDVTGIHQRVAEQAEVAIELADVVMFVVDATVGATDTDEQVVRLLPAPLGAARRPRRQQGRRPAGRGRRDGPVEPRAGSTVAGLGPARPSSGDVLDAVLDVLPAQSSVAAAAGVGGRAAWRWWGAECR